MVQVFPIREKIFPPFSWVYPMMTDAQEEQPENQQSVKCIDNLQALINMEIYSLSMAILTIYSIFAIDIQKSFFGQSQAYVFGYVHIICIMIFLVDMSFSWICKEDFKWSFYFWIDVISTTSMIMEITWVDNFLTDNSNLPAVLTIAKVVKASRLSRIGGRAAKIILMFLAYLKTKKKEEQQRLRNQVKNTESVAVESNVNRTVTVIDTKTKGDDHEYQLEEEGNDEIQVELPNKIDMNRMELDPIVEEKITERSQISDVHMVQKSSISHSKDSILQVPFMLGKKRSKLTRNSDNAALKKKAERIKTFDVTNIVERMIQTFKLQPLKNNNVPDSVIEDIEMKWNELCLKEEQARKQSRQKIKSNKQNFKLGETLKQRIQKNIIIMIMSLIIILPMISADTWFNKDPSIDQLIGNYFQVANSINDTETKRLFFQEMVNVAETGSYPILFIQTADGLNYPGTIMNAVSDNPPLQDFMRAEIIQVVGNNYQIVFNGRYISHTNAIINIARSCFITILLIFSTIIFMYSIETNALTPLEKMSVSINKIAINPFDALKEMKELDKKDEGDGKSELETNMLEEAVKKMTKILALGAGETGSELISNTVESVTSETGCTLINGSKIHGVFLCVKMANFQKVCDKWGDQIVETINKVATYLHDIVMQNGGIIVDNNPPCFVFFWSTPDDLNIERQTTKYYVPGNPLRNLGKTIETQKTIQVALRSYLQMNIALSEINKKWMDSYNSQDDFEPFFLQAGVHIGDAFKGSVGDSLKIEVKCMGEDIKFVRSICDLAQSYHLSNIVSEEVCEIMDDLVEAHMRKVDFVRARGDEESRLWLCTYDFSLYPIVAQIDKKDSRSCRKKKKTIRKPEKTFREKKQRSLILKHREDTLSRLKTDPMDVVMPYSSIEKKCVKPYNEKFYITWNYAIEHYYAGQWNQAIPLLESINERFDLGYRDSASAIFLQRIGTGGTDPDEGWEKAVEIDLD